MMTTETLHHTREAGQRGLLGAAAAAGVVTLGLALVGLVAAGSAAAAGALVGALLVLFVFGVGAFAVDLVASVMPAASLLVALLTYTLQVVLMGMLFWALSSSGTLGDEVDERWLAATVIAGTLVWLAVQIRQATRARIPVYDLGPDGRSGGES
jgi:ATP synthase protein I